MVSLSMNANTWAAQLHGNLLHSACGRVTREHSVAHLCHVSALTNVNDKHCTLSAVSEILSPSSPRWTRLAAKKGSTGGVAAFGATSAKTLQRLKNVGGLRKISCEAADATTTEALQTSQWLQKTIQLPEFKRGCHIITPHIDKVVPDISQFEVGVPNLFVMHTSASLTINDNANSNVPLDMVDNLNRIASEDLGMPASRGGKLWQLGPYLRQRFPPSCTPSCPVRPQLTCLTRHSASWHAATARSLQSRACSTGGLSADHPLHRDADEDNEDKARQPTESDVSARDADTWRESTRASAGSEGEEEWGGKGEVWGGGRRLRIAQYSGAGLALGALSTTLATFPSFSQQLSQAIASLRANPTFMSALIAWAMAQVLKVFTTYAVERRLDFKMLVASGGLPSSHSALCMALTVAVGLLHGLQGALFPVCLGFSLIVMYDATGVRYHAGMQAEVLNVIVAALFQGHPVSEKKLKELLGHTPLQVGAGATLGALVAVAYHNYCC